MAKSHTRKKHWRKKAPPTIQHPQLDQALTQAVKFLHQWTRKELSRLQTQGEVLILPGKNKNHYLIGRYQLQKQTDHCWSVSDAEVHVHDFYDKRSALYYCFGTQNKYSRHAEEVRSLDAELGRLTSDCVFYTHTAQQAVRAKNWAVYDIVQARLSQISSRLEYVQDQLEKTLRWAKYTKTQDDSHETTRIRY